MFFGAFQVVDKKVRERSLSSSLESVNGRQSYIDFAYGSNESSFAGVHRFSLQREESEGGSEESESERLRVTMSCLVCNPLEDRKPAPGWAWTFHRAYAMLLFREGVAEVVK